MFFLGNILYCEYVFVYILSREVFVIVIKSRGPLKPINKISTETVSTCVCFYYFQQILKNVT